MDLIFKDNLTPSIHDDSRIRKVRYFKVEKEDKEKQIRDAEQKVRDWKQNGLKGKKPPIPKFVELPNGDFYKRANKKYLEDHKDMEFVDWVDVKILPLLTDGEKRKGVLDASLKNSLLEDKDIKKILYKDDGKLLNDDTVKIIKDFLFRPEKEFTEEDANELSQKLKDDTKVDGENLGLFKGMFKKPEDIQETLKKLIEMIWKYTLRNIRKPSKKKTDDINEEYTLFDQLIEESFIDDDKDYPEVLSFEDFVTEKY